MNIACHRTSWEKSSCRIGVVHLGFGAFHRAHQGVYFDDCMEQTGDLRWGIAAVNLRASESEAFLRTAQMQDGYLLKTTSAQGHDAWRRVRSHIAFADWCRDKDKAENLPASECVHVITITVTESGYCLDKDGNLDIHSEPIKSELNGEAATSVYAFLAAALERRASNGNHPISILCCDNMRANGAKLERNFIAWLQQAGKRKLAQWVRAHATFPCSMVDRITPRSTPELHAEAEALFPGHNSMAINSEAFIQWVVEDNFAGEFPALDKVGVEIVADVHPHEEAKIRILNGGHTGLAYLGALAGHRSFDQAMGDKHCRLHFDRLQDENILPALTLDLPFDKHAYRRMVTERLSNRAIADPLERICMDGWVKFRLFIVPTLMDCLRQGINPTLVYDSIAAWYVYARLWAAGRMGVEYIEANRHLLAPLLQENQAHAFASAPDLWGDLPQTCPEFAPALVTAITNMERKWQNCI